MIYNIISRLIEDVNTYIFDPNFSCKSRRLEGSTQNSFDENWEHIESILNKTIILKSYTRLPHFELHDKQDLVQLKLNLVLMCKHYF